MSHDRWFTAGCNYTQDGPSALRMSFPLSASWVQRCLAYSLPSGDIASVPSNNSLNSGHFHVFSCEPALGRFGNANHRSLSSNPIAVPSSARHVFGCKTLTLLHARWRQVVASARSVYSRQQSKLHERSRKSPPNLHSQARRLRDMHLRGI